MFGRSVQIFRLFLQSAARMSYEQLLMRRMLEGEPIRQFVHTPVETVPASISLKELVEDYIYRYHFKMFPVTQNGDLLGCVSTRDVGRVPRERWPDQTVSDVTEPCGDQNSIAGDADALSALQKMHKNSVSRLLVVDDGHLEGVISLKDMMRLISIKLELEGEDDALASSPEVEREVQKLASED